MSAVDLALARSFLVLFSALDFAMPVLLAWQLIDLVRSLASGEFALENIALRFGLLALVFLVLPLTCESFLGHVISCMSHITMS